MAEGGGIARWPGSAAKNVRLPPRYFEPWREQLWVKAEPLEAGATVLDVGSGRRPALAPSKRPTSCRYVGLDVSRSELDAAPTGSYDATVVCDVLERVPELEGEFDLALSWQVLEHVRSTERAVENLHEYLRPGGRLVAVISGGRSVVALLNRCLPHSLTVGVMRRLLGRPPETVFPAHYDGCTFGALTRTLAQWSVAEIVPLYRGATYFSFSFALQALYLRYEETLIAQRRADYATHYLIVATR